MHQTENKYVYEYIRLLIANGKQINSDDCDSAGGADIAMWLHKEENSHAQSLILLCCTRFFILFLINYHNAVLIGAKTYWCIPITINENELRRMQCWNIEVYWLSHFSWYDAMQKKQFTAAVIKPTVASW